MKDKSGASRHGPEDPGDERARPLRCSTSRCSRWRPASRCRWCTRSPSENDRALLDVAVAAEVNLVGDPILRRGRRGARGRQRAERGDGGGGGDRRAEARRAGARLHPGADRPFAHSGLRDGRDEAFDTVEDRDGRRRPGALFLATPEEADDPAARGDAGARSRRAAASRCSCEYLLGFGGRLSRDAILAAIATTIAWGPLMRKRITPADGRDAALVPAALRRDGRRDDPGRAPPVGQLCAASRATSASAQWTMADLCFLAMTGKKPTPEEALPLQILVGLLISQRPGLDLGAGRQGRGLGRRAADARPGADQQGDGRLPDPHRLQPRRQRLRGHGLPARPVQGQGAEGPDRSRRTAST